MAPPIPLLLLFVFDSSALWTAAMSNRSDGRLIDSEEALPPPTMERLRDIRREGAVDAAAEALVIIGGNSKLFRFGGCCCCCWALLSRELGISVEDRQRRLSFAAAAAAAASILAAAFPSLIAFPLLLFRRRHSATPSATRRGRASRAVTDGWQTYSMIRSEHAAAADEEDGATAAGAATRAARR